MIRLKDLISEALHDNSRIIKMAKSNNKSEIAKIKKVLLNADWTEKEISGAIKKAKDIIKKKEDVDQAKKDKKEADKVAKAEAKAKKKLGGWTKGKYNKWIRDNASNGGRDNSHDMAQNAKHEKGLIDFVKLQIKRNYGDETPLERIQWDIEAA